MLDPSLRTSRLLLHLQYEADSAPALALNATIDRTEKRFATYARQGLLCGADGLPHLISDPGLAIRYGHAGETLVSSTLDKLQRCMPVIQAGTYCTSFMLSPTVASSTTVQGWSIFPSLTLSYATLSRLNMDQHHRLTYCVLQVPTIGFLYIAGYIGYVGRDYIKTVKADKKPTEKEIIIDVPFAIKLAFQGVGWPFRAIQELRAGTLTEDDSKITVSPR